MGGPNRLDPAMRWLAIGSIVGITFLVPGAIDRPGGSSGLAVAASGEQVSSACVTGTGEITAQFLRPDSAPLEGLYVLVDGTDRVGVTDCSGSVRITGVPAGQVSISLVKPFAVNDMIGNPLETGYARLDNAIDVTVVANRTTTFQGTVAVTEPTVHGPPCPATPWCIAGCLRDFGRGVWRARGAAGVNGPCPCTVAVANLPGPAACPGSGPNIGGPFPAPGLLRTVTTSTCLGGGACVPPVKTVTCSVVC